MGLDGRFYAQPCAAKSAAIVVAVRRASFVRTNHLFASLHGDLRTVEICLVASRNSVFENANGLVILGDCNNGDIKPLDQSAIGNSSRQWLFLVTSDVKQTLS